MPRVKAKSEHDLDRHRILEYLNECGLQPVTPKSIFVYMDDTFQPVSIDGVIFHLRYMADLRWVELGEEKEVGMAGKIVRWARITAAGVDEFDRWAKTMKERG